jgi:uncharacterized protein YbaR (Trm112 family)
LFSINNLVGVSHLGSTGGIGWEFPLSIERDSHPPSLTERKKREKMSVVISAYNFRTCYPISTFIPVVISKEIISEAEDFAHKVDEHNKKMGRVPQNGCVDPLGAHLLGFPAEAAFAWYARTHWGINVWPDRELGVARKKPDFPGGVESRNRTGHNATMIVRPDDFTQKDGAKKIYVLMTFERRCNYHLVGWIYGPEARNQNWWGSPNSRPPCWWVPQEDLRPITDLPKVWKERIRAELGPVAAAKIVQPDPPKQIDLFEKGKNAY